MNKAFPVSIDDPAVDCPISPGMLSRLYRGDAGSRRTILDGISEPARAQLAVWLYGRSHTHELSVWVAKTCEGSALHRAAGPLGDVLYDLSRQPYVSPAHGTIRTATGRRITLAGSSNASAFAA